MPDIGGLVTTTVLNTKIGEAENEIPNVTDLVNKSNYITKISHIEKKYFTTADYNKFSSDILGNEIKQKKVNMSNISNLINNSDVNTQLKNISNKIRIESRVR